MDKAAKAHETHEKLKYARQSGLRWFLSKDRGILEYTPQGSLRILLISWAVMAGIGLLLGLFFPTQTDIRCQRETPGSTTSATTNTGECSLRKVYLNPLLLFYRPEQKFAVADYTGATVVEIVGDESDSYEVRLTGKNGGEQYLFTPFLESTAEDKAEELDYFLKTPAEPDVRVKHLNLIFVLMFDLPLWLLTVQVLASLFLKLAGRPLHSQRIIIDPERRQLITARVGVWGGLKTEQHPLANVRDLRVKRNQNDKSVTYEIVANVGSKPVSFIKRLILPSDVPDSYLYAICAQADQFLLDDIRKAKAERKAQSGGPKA